MKSIWIFAALVSLAAPASEISFFERFAKDVRDRKVVTLEKALELLPKEQFSHYTLMRKSRSSQGATPQSPRAIVYGKDAKIIVTFNGGEPTLRGNDRLEFMEFREDGRRIQLNALRFPTAKNGLQAPENVDTAECGSCHGEDPHSIWAPYSTWPGAYGQDDDRLFISEELEFFEFKPKMPTHPRYRFLPLDPKNPVSPYDPDFKGTLDHRPNLNLLVLLSRWNSRRLARRLEESGNASITVPLMVSMWSDCQGFALESLGAATDWFGDWVTQMRTEPSGYWERRALSGSIARQAGITLDEWRLEIPENYEDLDAYVYDDATAPMAALVASSLFRNLAKKEPVLAKHYAHGTYFQNERRKPETIVVDELGGSLKVDSKEVCPTLQRILYDAVKKRGLWAPPKEKEWKPRDGEYGSAAATQELKG